MSLDDYNSNYEPSYIVRQAHDILHLDASLRPVSNDFDITYSSQWNEYSRSLLPIPIICMTLGILAIVILQLVLCFRICCKSCRCLPKIDASGPFISEQVIKTATSPRYGLLFWSFIFFAIVTVLSDQMLIFGNHYLTEGVNTSKDAVNYVYDLSTSLNNQGNYLLNNGTILETDLNNASPTCPLAAQLASGVQYYTNYIDDYLGYVSPIPGRCNDATDGLEKWGEYYKNCTIWAIYALILILIILYAAGVFMKNKCFLQTAIAITQCFMIILFLLVGVEMVIIMGMGDFCMNPLSNTANLIPRDIYNVTSYYLDCSGVNSLQTDLNDAFLFVDQYDIYINQLLDTTCPGNAYLIESLDVLKTINTTLLSVEGEIACPPIQSQLADVIQTGLCEQSFEGIYSIWLGQYFSVSFIFLVTIIVSIIYQYFGQFWGDIEIQSVDNPAFEDVHVEQVPQNVNEYYYQNSLHNDNTRPESDDLTYLKS